MARDLGIAVQHEAIPQALLGMDVLCQAKSGMGKTAVFVLTTLNQITPSEDVNVIVLCHTRELAYQIGNEFNRFAKYMPGVKCVSPVVHNVGGSIAAVTSCRHVVIARC